MNSSSSGRSSRPSARRRSATATGSSGGAAAPGAFAAGAPAAAGGSAGTRRHAIGVEDAVDVAQAVDRLLERLRVGDLDDEPVLNHGRGDDAARLDDVAAGLGERPGEVLEEAVAVPGVDLQLDLERLLVLALPMDAHEALGILAQRGGVRAVVAVDRDAAPERHVADDRVAGHRAAALGQAQHHVVDALDADSVGAARPGRLAALAARRDERLDAALLLRGLALLEPLQDLVD